jgi:hypothetical protein
MENKTDKNQAKTENKESLVFDRNKKEQAKIIKFSLVALWVVALIFGIGFKLWFLFFIALFLTIAYLCKINNVNIVNRRGGDNSSSKKWYNDPSYKSLSGNVWHNTNNRNRH